MSMAGFCFTEQLLHLPDFVDTYSLYLLLPVYMIVDCFLELIFFKNDESQCGIQATYHNHMSATYVCFVLSRPLSLQSSTKSSGNRTIVYLSNMGYCVLYKSTIG